MFIRDLTEEQRKKLQVTCRERLTEYARSSQPLMTIREMNLWDKAFSEGLRAILALVDKLNG